MKLDRSFVDSYRESGRHNIATAVIQLARALGLDAVAEGIETPQQADDLYKLGYRSAQGYLFHHPLPAESISALLAAGTGALRQDVA